MTDDPLMSDRWDWRDLMDFATGHGMKFMSAMGKGRTIDKAKIVQWLRASGHCPIRVIDEIRRGVEGETCE